MVKVEMEATRENMIYMLSPFFPRSYLNSLKQKELLKLGAKQKVWNRKSSPILNSTRKKDDK